VKDPAEYPFLLALTMSAADRLVHDIQYELDRHGYGLTQLEQIELAQTVEDRAYSHLVSLRAEPDAA
jgi:hypothetical protein